MLKTALALGLAGSALALDNGMGLTPPMGFNTWNRFACDINETLIMETADALVESGMAAAGFSLLALDDCWALSRDENNKIQPDPEAFPSGMAALGQYVTGKGLQYGIYSDAGVETCAGRPGSLGYETEDAESYADWGVTMLKYDNCNSDWLHPQPRYEAMRDALNATGVPIYFDMCEWGLGDPSKWARPIANSWRVTQDIRNSWGSVMWITDRNAKNAPAAGPGGWNDMDMLEVGNGVLSDVEGQTHFAIWAALKSPLLVGNDVRSMSEATAATLMNKRAIAVNQDPLGRQATRRQRKLDGAADADLWAGPLADGGCVVLVVNRDRDAASLTVDLGSYLGIASAVATDVWSGATTAIEDGQLKCAMDAHGNCFATLDASC